MVYEIAVIVLLAIICFLLYQLYRLKYKMSASTGGFAPFSAKTDFKELDDRSPLENEKKIMDINSRISELERRIEKNEDIVEKLIEELG